MRRHAREESSPDASVTGGWEESGLMEDSAMSVGLRRGVSFFEDERGRPNAGPVRNQDEGEDVEGSGLYDDGGSDFGDASLFSRGYLQTDAGSVRSLTRGDDRRRSGGHSSSLRHSLRASSLRGNNPSVRSGRGRKQSGRQGMSRSLMSQSGLGSFAGDPQQNSILSGLSGVDSNVLNTMFRKKSMHSIDSRASEQASDMQRLLGSSLNGNLYGYEDEDHYKPMKKNGDTRRKLAYLQCQIPLYYVMGFVESKIRFHQLAVRAILFFPLLIMFCFFAEFHSHGVEHSFYFTEYVRQHYERMEFPTNARVMEKFRQEQQLGLRPWLELDRDFLEISTALEWRNFFSDVVLARVAEMDHVWSPLTAGNSPYFAGALRARMIRVRDGSGVTQKKLYPDADDAESDVPRDTWDRGHGAKHEDRSPYYCPSVLSPMDNYTTPLYKYVACDKIKNAPKVTFDSYHCGGYMMSVPFAAEKKVIKDVMSIVQNFKCSFVDNWSTRLAVIEFFMYFPSGDLWLSVKFVSRIEASGWFQNSVQYVPFRVWTKTYKGEVVYSACFLAYLVFYTAIWLMRLITYIKRKKMKSFAGSFWNYLDFAIIVIAFVAVGFYFHWVVLSVKFGPKALIPMAGEYPDFLDTLASLLDTKRLVCSINIILLLWRVLEFSYFFNSLRAIVEALANSVLKLIAIVVVFFVITLGYALAGWASFGAASHQFRSIGSTLALLMRLPIDTTDYYPSPETTNAQFALLYFLTYYVGVAMATSYLIIAVLILAYQKSARRFWLVYDVKWMDRNLRLLRSAFCYDNFSRTISSLFFVTSTQRTLSQVHQCLHEKLQRAEELYVRKLDDKVREAVDAEVGRIEKQRNAAKVMEQGLVAPDKRGAASVLEHASPLPNTRSPTAVSSSSSGRERAEREEAFDGSLTRSGSAGSPMGRPKSASTTATFPASPANRANAAPAPGLTGFPVYDRVQSNSFEHSWQVGEESLDMLRARLTALFKRQYRREAVATPQDTLLMMFDDWNLILPEKLKEAMGGDRALMYVWICIVESYQETVMTAAEVEKRQFLRKVQESTKRLLGHELEKVERMENTLTQLERHVGTMLGILDARNPLEPTNREKNTN